jgi:NAD(P)-dependent dehydrogenase (short-subunit alcohol dehydrogenase family)
VACEAIEGLWRSLAAELGPRGVRLVCLRSAGSPDTPAVQEVFKLHAKAAGLTLEEYSASSGSGTLLGRLPMLAEVANVATILASDRASALTGTFINVTCGSRVD